MKELGLLLLLFVYVCQASELQPPDTMVVYRLSEGAILTCSSQGVSKVAGIDGWLANTESDEEHSQGDRGREEGNGEEEDENEEESEESEEDAGGGEENPAERGTGVGGEVMWLDESGRPITNINELREVSGDQLLLLPVEESQYQADVHNVEYRCHVGDIPTTYGDSGLDYRAFVKAVIPFGLKVKPDEYNSFPLGERGEIPCQGQGIPAPTVTWKKLTGNPSQPNVCLGAEDPLSTGLSVTPEGTLVVAAAGRHHQGHYSCSLKQGSTQEVEFHVMIEIVGEPKVRAMSPNVSVCEGCVAELRCEVEGQWSAITWSKGGQTVYYDLDTKYSHQINHLADGISTTVLGVTASGLQNSELYTCAAHNIWGTGVDNIILQVQDGSETTWLPKYGVETDQEEALNKVMKNIDKWGIDIFQVANLTNNKPLTAIIYTILKNRGLLNTFLISENRLVNFLTVAEGRYQPVPFHNSIHAADIVQSSHVLLSLPSLQGKFSNLEILATLFAGAIHDIDHPGRTDQCLAPAPPSIPEITNQTSLEDHHLAVAFQLLEDGDLNFLDVLAAEEREVFEHLVRAIVLGTGLKNHNSHMEFLTSMTREVNDLCGPRVVLSSSEDRVKFLSTLVHVADLSTPTKPFHLYDQWVAAILTEFFTQGDQEKNLGHRVNPMCDRTVANEDTVQIGFLDHLVIPLWTTWTRFLPSAAYMRDLLEQNREKYRMQDKVHQDL